MRQVTEAAGSLGMRWWGGENLAPCKMCFPGTGLMEYCHWGKGGNSQAECTKSKADWEERTQIHSGLTQLEMASGFPEELSSARGLLRW
jgi:hypothetical protein